MVMEPRPQPSVVRGMERAILYVLIGLVAVMVLFSVALGPVLVLPIIVCGVLALGIGQLLRRSEGMQAAELARAAGAREAVIAWGRIASVVGECPTGKTPRRGQMFAVAGSEVWPEVCPHAQRIILAEAARMESDPELDEEPVHFRDADHQIEIELFREPESVRRAA